MEELHKQILAMQLIQELIVDKCDESGLFTREDFEIDLAARVDALNEKIDELKQIEKDKPEVTPTMCNKVYEA